ncbi:MAG: hypothetical protein NVS3B14_16550 [Ktedonobacteraceae bacterium]
MPTASCISNLPTDFGYILACKLMAGRPDKDDADIAVLCMNLGVRTREQAQGLVNRFFPDPYKHNLHMLRTTLSRLFPGQ